MKKIFISLLLTGLMYSQQQVDILWPTLANSPWPMIKHDPQFTGRSPYKGPQTGTVVWTVDMEDGIFSGPVIGEEGNLYFGSYFQDPPMQGLSDYFYSYSPEGNYIWDYKLGRNRPPQTGIVIDSSNTIYFGSLDRYLYALNPDGTLKWEFETSAPIFEVTMPNIDLEGNIYITNNNGELYSVKDDGTLNWNVIYENGFAGKSPVFSPDGKTIYIAGKDSNLFALNLDGSLKWKFSCGTIQRAPLVDTFGNIYFIPSQADQYFYSINSNGSIRWNYKLTLATHIYSIPTLDKYGNLYAIGLDTTCCPYYRLLFSLSYEGIFRWSYIFYDEEIDDFWQPLICDSEGTVYVGSTLGYYYYAISNEGELKWKLPLNDYQVDNTGTISSDGTLYLGVHKVSLVTGQKKTLIAIRDTATVNVHLDNPEIKTYSLSQNYPNPFNPTTSFEYIVTSIELVTLKVYDVLGRELVTLINEEKQPGVYDIEFDGSRLSSGIYYYQLKVDDFIETKKMILLK
jgi:outer membrane protein assembly factor BamB